MLHVTVHAEKRFLQRVLNIEDHSSKMLKRAGHWLSQEFDLTKPYIDGRYTFPSFPKFVIVVSNNAIVTVRAK